MAEENRGSRPQDDRRAGPPGGRGGRQGPRRRVVSSSRYYPRRKVCSFCMDNVRTVDYKEVGRLRRYVSDRGKIEPRRQTGTCAKHQRLLTVAIKRARHLGLLPFAQ